MCHKKGLPLAMGHSAPNDVFHLLCQMTLGNGIEESQDGGGFVVGGGGGGGGGRRYLRRRRRRRRRRRLPASVSGNSVISITKIRRRNTASFFPDMMDNLKDKVKVIF